MTTYKILGWIIEPEFQKIEQGLTQNIERINIKPSDMVQVGKNCSAPFSHMTKK
jgi:hypothetical protein